MTGTDLKIGAPINAGCPECGSSDIVTRVPRIGRDNFARPIVVQSQYCKDCGYENEIDEEFVPQFCPCCESYLGK